MFAGVIFKVQYVLSWCRVLLAAGLIEFILLPSTALSILSNP
jgi:hypothetical protein